MMEALDQAAILGMARGEIKLCVAVATSLLTPIQKSLGIPRRVLLPRSQSKEKPASEARRLRKGANPTG